MDFFPLDGKLHYGIGGIQENIVKAIEKTPDFIIPKVRCKLISITIFSYHFNLNYIGSHMQGNIENVGICGTYTVKLSQIRYLQNLRKAYFCFNLSGFNLGASKSKRLKIDIF